MINGQYLIIVHTFIFVPTPFQHNFHGVERLITVTFVEINLLLSGKPFPHIKVKG